jgi:hypothetical protein
MEFQMKFHIQYILPKIWIDFSYSTIAPKGLVALLISLCLAALASSSPTPKPIAWIGPSKISQGLPSAPLGRWLAQQAFYSFLSCLGFSHLYTFIGFSICKLWVETLS